MTWAANGGQVVGDVLTFETETSQKKDGSYGTIIYGVTPVMFTQLRLASERPVFIDVL